MNGVLMDVTPIYAIALCVAAVALVVFSLSLRDLVAAGRELNAEKRSAAVRLNRFNEAMKEANDSGFGVRVDAGLASQQFDASVAAEVERVIDLVEDVRKSLDAKLQDQEKRIDRVHVDVRALAEMAVALTSTKEPARPRQAAEIREPQRQSQFVGERDFESSTH